MHNTKSPKFENHYLNRSDSIENNLKAWQQHHAFPPVKYQAIPSQNAWLNCGEAVDKALKELLIQGEIVAQQAEALSRDGMISPPVQSLIERFQALGEKLAEKSNTRQHRHLADEYQQLADHIMPTLARINQRVEARREATGIHSASQISLPVAEETLNVAMRAALKLRG